MTGQGWEGLEGLVPVRLCRALRCYLAPGCGGRRAQGHCLRHQTALLLSPGTALLLSPAAQSQGRLLGVGSGVGEGIRNSLVCATGDGGWIQGAEIWPLLHPDRTMA